MRHQMKVLTCQVSVTSDLSADVCVSETDVRSNPLLRCWFIFNLHELDFTCFLMITRPWEMEAVHPPREQITVRGQRGHGALVRDNEVES